MIRFIRRVGGSAIVGNCAPRQECSGAPRIRPVLHFSVPKLYAAIPGADKLMFRVQDWDHNPVWERKPAQTLQQMSWKWLQGKKVYGVERGSWFMDRDGVLAQVE